MNLALLQIKSSSSLEIPEEVEIDQHEQSKYFRIDDDFFASKDFASKK